VNDDCIVGAAVWKEPNGSYFCGDGYMFIFANILVGYCCYCVGIPKGDGVKV
jgi:hypothetical protein